jgi:hypothetical protein
MFLSLGRETIYKTLVWMYKSKYKARKSPSSRNSNDL